MPLALKTPQHVTQFMPYVHLIKAMHLHLAFMWCDSLPGLGQAVQAGLDVLLVELNLFIVHFGLLVQLFNGQLEPVQFLLALLAVAVLVADVLQAHTHTHTQTYKYTLARSASFL